MARRRMGHDSSGFIQDQAGAIFEQNLEQRRLSIKPQGRGLGSIESDLIAALILWLDLAIRSLTRTQPAVIIRCNAARESLGSRWTRNTSNRFGCSPAVMTNSGLHNRFTLLQRLDRMQTGTTG